MHRTSLFLRLGLLAGTCAGLPSLFACLNHPLKPAELDSVSEENESIAISVNKNVDILFVIDNSGSMAEEQANLAANFQNFISVLEAERVEANYRIGITTTDNGNPVCSGTSPEGGALRLSSCRERQPEFIAQTAGNPDRTQEACLDVCVHDSIAVTPTPTDFDEAPKARPWMERIEGVTNLPAGVTTTEAFQCFGPQGINGCGFESHLESMYKALTRVETASEASYGFMRRNALLAIIFVTDEADCSYDPDQGSAFLQTGDRALWEDPNEPNPSSAICWNAGVQCTPEGAAIYDECHAANVGIDGRVGVDDNAAVLFPIAKYIDFVQGIENEKRSILGNTEVIVAAISGVPVGYEAGQVAIEYKESADPMVSQDFGIDYGCSAAGLGEAVPPVRLREFAETFEVNGERNLYSVCADNYGPALNAIAKAIEDQLRPACMTKCVQDTDPTTQILEPECALKQEWPDAQSGTQNELDVPQCNGERLPDGVDVCWVAVIDPGVTTPDDDSDDLTPGVTYDDMSPECAEDGYNLEFRLVRSADVPEPPGAQISATCQLSSAPDIDCPGL